MASSRKPMVEIFQPAKCLKALTTSPVVLNPQIPHLRPLQGLSHRLRHQRRRLPPTGIPSIFTLDQKRRIEIDKALATSKRNLRLCTEKIERAKADGMDYVRLEEILVEKTWLEALPGELQKPYAKNLGRFVKRAIGRSVPIYPPRVSYSMPSTYAL